MEHIDRSHRHVRIPEHDSSKTYNIIIYILPPIFWKSNFRDNSWPNSTTHRGNFWWGFGTRAPIRAWATPIPIYGHRQMIFLFLAQYYANRGLSERSRSPEYQDIKIFEIGWKMTELRALTRCPNMGAGAIMALKSALKWANINIFQWDHSYMISRDKLHACGEWQLHCC